MVLTFAAFSLVMGVLSPLIKYVALLGENPVYAESMTSYFNQLINADLKYFNDNLTGYLTTAARQYNDSVLTLVRKLRDNYLGVVLSILLPLVVISITDIRLGLVTFGLSSVQAIYLLWASNRITPYRTKSREIYKYISGFISDAITNAIAVKSTGQEKNRSKGA